MFSVVKFKPEHVSQMDLFGDAAEVFPKLTASELKDLSKRSGVQRAYTCVHEGRPVAMFGAKVWAENMVECWTAFDKNCKECFLQCRNAIRNALDTYGADIMEAYIYDDFTQGHRWMKTLGFVKCEGFKTPYKDNKKRTVYMRRRKWELK